MATFVKELGGYIADVPNVDFQRCDGKVYSFDEVNSFSLTYNNENLTITGGQGNFPLAYIDTSKTIEANMTSSQIAMDLFEMANDSEIVVSDKGTRESARYDVETGLKLTIPYEVKAGSVKISGLEEASAVAAGKFKVTITAATAEADGKTEITFNDGDVTVGDTIRVSYIRRVVNANTVAVKTNSASSKGELWAHWPVYSSGVDCSESSIKAYLHLHIDRVRATAMPGIDASYKSAATQSITWSGLDPKRADGNMFDWSYEELGTDGKIVSKSAKEVKWD